MMTFFNVTINLIAFIVALLTGLIFFGDYSKAIDWVILYIEIGLLSVMIIMTIIKLLLLRKNRLQ